MSNFLYITFWFCLGLSLAISLGCATAQHTKIGVCGVQDGISYNVEYTLEY
jgi:hypothetical protein